MTALQAVVLGLIQGLTEFLPISSSGHLVFVPKIFGWADQGLLFDVVLHLGTLAAVVFYFRERLISLITSPAKDDRLMLFYLLFTVVPAAFVGLVFGDWIEENIRAAWVVGASLIFWGIFLAAADGFAGGLAKHNADKGLKRITWKNVLFIACAQAIALIPGTSRSGITMTAGMFARLDKKSAAEFSFLMSIPVIALAGVYKLFQLIGEQAANSLVIYQFNNLLIGFIVSAISGFTAIKLLMKIIEKWSFMPFVVYRITIGVAILLFL